MQISEQTVDDILNHLLGLLKDKDKTISNLNGVIAEMADENLEKSKEICKLYSERKYDEPDNIEC